ncbi:MAG TPA: nucleotide sugar dehydrogenase [Candidatus Moranbacteria bacterium]|nr:nucleotide sugar dehydrogenase [Candidatus Moranbacteria bacterium]
MQNNKKHSETVAVIGLGYVGLPLAIRVAERGYKTYGFDMDKKKIEAIKKERSPFKEEFIEKRKHLLSKINASIDPTVLKKADIVVVCVPTPVDEKFYPIFEPLISAIELIIKNRKAGQLIIIESTINPGVCEEVLIPFFSKAKLVESKDYFIAHCPERINPGKDAVSKGYNVTNIARVVGAMSKKGLLMAQKFYESIIDAPIKPMGSIKEAEACKVVENSFRDINIAFVNELAKSFNKMGIDVKNVIEGAATKPFAFMAHYPSRGVGGHCIPVDPYYLIERAKESGFDHKFLRVAREINNSMPAYTVELMHNLLNELGLSIKGTPIGLMGLSYKANVDDLRESPAIKIIEELKKKGARIIRFDPFIKSMSDVDNLEELLQKSKALILVTNHQVFLDIDPKVFKKFGIKAIVDGVNCLDKEKIKKLGIKYRGIGRK